MSYKSELTATSAANDVLRVILTIGLLNLVAVDSRYLKCHPLQRQVPVMTYTQPGMGITTIEAGKWPSWKGLQHIDV